ncbi:acetyl-coenzyme A synthetase [Listeria floridensis FSL S10-1187]|uniref:Acetyl-coenzyme A synthetase n=1 Tax=Listeria floridensis FSL S10-1187 TaxID=1265817 RepID=A0ABP3AX40_9LIST|nr:acetyl-coenzyme A synthetase [Listeria floridensis FSL S10-1187]
MYSENLIAPKIYNITDEITKFASDKIALIWKKNADIEKKLELQ